MHWLKSGFKNRLNRIWGRRAQVGRVGSAPKEMEDIRACMLAALEAHGIADSGLAHRIRNAQSFMGLWDLRVELMTTLARVLGEAASGQAVTHITNMFRR